MLVDHQGFIAYVEKLKSLPPRSFVGLDLETTGLKPWAGARAFLVGLSSAELGEIAYYLTEESGFLLKHLVELKNVRWVAHKAMFEMSFFDVQFGLEFVGDVWDSMVFARVEFNDHRSYRLEACAERAGLDCKYKPAMDWLEENGPKYHEMPRDLVVPYVELDAKICRQLAEHQLAVFKDWEQNSPHPISAVVKLELQTTKNLYAMVKAGIRLNLEYMEQATRFEHNRIGIIEDNFKQDYGLDFVDSAKFLTPIFEKEGLKYGVTEKGNASFAAAALKVAGKDHPLVKSITAHRDALKRHGTYWLGLKEYAFNGELHPDIFQTGAANFRMSIKDPALQTLPDDSEDPDCVFPIRRALIAREGCHLVVFDWSQMELGFMADEAEDMLMIERIRSGFDFHKDISAQANVPRSQAKQGNFCRRYGGGVARVAATLGIEMETAARLCKMMDEQSPDVTRYNRGLINYAKRAPYICNWLGRRYHFDRGFEFKAPNYRSAGGCAEIIRIAIQDIRPFLLAERKDSRTEIVLAVHDELDCNFAQEDLRLIPEVRRLMVEAHRSRKHLVIPVSVSIGKNLHDQEAWAA